MESPQKHEDQDQSYVHRRHNGDIHDCGASDVGGGGDDGGVGGGGTTKSWRVASAVPLKTEPLLVGVPPVQETKFEDKIKSLPHQQKPESRAQLLCLTARTIF